MNGTDQLDPFESALLSELRREVAAHPASAPARRRPPRRRLKLVAAGAVATVAATVAAVGLTGGGPTASPAFAVEKASDGGVVVTIHALEDASGLAAALSAQGVDAKVDFDANGVGDPGPQGGTQYAYGLQLDTVPAGPRTGPRPSMDELCGPLDPDPATLEHEAVDWVLAIPAGSPLLSRRIAIQTDPQGGLVVSYEGSQPGTGCMIFGD